MKKTLYFNFIFGYLLFAVFSFLIIYHLSARLTYQNLVKKQAQILYDNANVSAYQYELYEMKSGQNSDKFHNLVKAMARTLDAQVWVIDQNGKVLVDSSKYFYDDNTIEGFDPTYFGSNYYRIGTFFGYFNEEVLSVSVPITESYRTLGYVLIHAPLGPIQENTDNMMRIHYLSYGIVFILSLIILIIFTVSVYRPLKKISIASNEYAKGNFTYAGLKIKTNNEMGRLADSLNYMASELNNMEEDQKKFIANISHDFRSPLTSIKGYIEAMKDGTIPAQMREKYLDTVLFETERLNKLTSNLLTLNDWDNKASRLNLSDFDINTVVRRTVETFEGTCSKRKIKFDILFGDKVYMVNADMGKIQQVLYNLIDNALKFSSNNSVIKISVYNKYEKVFVSVKDHGAGIPKENITKIWDRFFKTDTSRGKDKTGTGLGLSIAKEIIQSHNENINVISTQGVGTEFIFTLQKAKKKT